MTMHHSRSSRTARCAVAVLLGLAGAAQAAGAAKSADPLRLQYEREKAACLTGQTQQPRNVCLREAGAAYAQARQGRLVSPGDTPEQWAANALKRCQAQPVKILPLIVRRAAQPKTAAASGSLHNFGSNCRSTARLSTFSV